MEKESKKVVHIKRVDGVLNFGRSTAKLIEEKNLRFEYNGQFFKVKRVELDDWEACCECRIASICFPGVRSICETFDRELGGCHMLELANSNV